jgi:predicted transcriptional regulator
MDRLDLKEGELGRLLSAADRQILRTIRGPVVWSLDSLAQETGLSETAIHLSCDRLESLGLLQGFAELPTAFPPRRRPRR